MEKNKIIETVLRICDENLKRIKSGITKNGSNMAQSHNSAIRAQIGSQCSECYALWASNEGKIGCFTGKLNEMVSRRVSGDIAPQCQLLTKVMDGTVIYYPDQKRYVYNGAEAFFKSVR